jgi:phosphoglycerate kinase
LRFYKEETENVPEFSKKLASLDIYINDAFGTTHVSKKGITKFVEQKVAVFLMAKELDFLGDKVSNTESPFVVILDGAKVSDKINVINNLLDKAILC